MGALPPTSPTSTPTLAPQLASFLKSVAAHAHLCWVQPERRVGCNLTLPVRCPLPLDGTEAGGAVSSLGHGGQSVLTPSRCCSIQHQQAHALEDVECAGTSWTRSAALAQVAGTAAPIFVRGPIRLAPPELYGFALFPGRTNVIMVHYRHPVEAFVSLFYCVSKPEVCPRRISRRGANNSEPPATAVGGLDWFLLDELKGAPSTALNLLLRARTTFEPPPVLRPFSTPNNPRTLRVAVRFEGLLQFQRSAQRWRGDAAVLLLESRYEQMVGDFGGWLRRLLGALPLPPAARRELQTSLLADFRDEFTATDGGHKHALFAGAQLHGHQTPPPANSPLTDGRGAAGANLAKLRPDTVATLRGMPRIARVVSELGYGWSVAGLQAASRARDPASSTAGAEPPLMHGRRCRPW